MPMPTLMRPPALRPGDTVAIAALSGGLERADMEQYQQAVTELESMGLRVRAAPLVDVEKVWWWAAAKPAEVARELNDLFRDPEVRAIWALAGGRFVLSYLDDLDYDAIAANPKPVIGMSDISALNLAIHSRTGLVTFHADPIMYGVSEWRLLSAPDRARIADAYRRVLMSPEAAGPLPALSSWETWRPGRARGHLLGGMLARFFRVQGDPGDRHRGESARASRDRRADRLSAPRARHGRRASRGDALLGADRLRPVPAPPPEPGGASRDQRRTNECPDRRRGARLPAR